MHNSVHNNPDLALYGMFQTLRTNKNYAHLISLLLGGTALLIPYLNAQATPHKYSPATTGFLGLNTIPNARMDETGTIRIGTSLLDPYLHGFIGVQIAAPLSITLRQSAQTSNPTKGADALYPGIDFKLRLIKENAYRPALVLGAQSAFGHKRMAGEYLAISKRYKNLDISFGLGWGRFGTAAHFDNPLKAISQHFKSNRDFNDESPNDPRHWFTGDKIGLFAGAEYFLPYDGLSIKLDYGADRYTAERSSFNYNAPAPWGIGLSYAYKDWLSAGFALQGTDKIMARLSLQSLAQNWPHTHTTDTPQKPFYKQRPATQNDTIDYGAQIKDITRHNKTTHAQLESPDATNIAKHIMRAAKNIAQNTSPETEEINITLTNQNLRGTTLSIMRSDLENALINNQGSPQEIWDNMRFETNKNPHNNHTKNWRDIFSKQKRIKKSPRLTFTLENQFSLSEEDSGLLYRTSALINTRQASFLGLTFGTSLRINLKDNLNNIEKFRTPAVNPVRSDINAFTKTRIALDTAYIAYTNSITPQLHTAITAGYLEEAYAGIGAEILYRPIKSRFAVGAELWLAQKRNPYTLANIGYQDKREITGHINAWYDLPNMNTTLNIQAGRYLFGDIGGALGIEKHFKNGAKLSGKVTITNYNDPDQFGGTTHAYHTINLTLPLGSIKYIPNGSIIRTAFAPFGRDIGQTLRKPLSLFEMSDPFTIDRIAKNWKNSLK